jgi:hypothetical protein
MYTKTQIDYMNTLPYIKNFFKMFVDFLDEHIDYKYHSMWFRSRDAEIKIIAQISSTKRDIICIYICDESMKFYLQTKSSKYNSHGNDKNITELLQNKEKFFSDVTENLKLIILVEQKIERKRVFDNILFELLDDYCINENKRTCKKRKRDIDFSDIVSTYTKTIKRERLCI